MNSVIEIREFKKQYRNHLVELPNIIVTKRISLLVGENGSGKTTLLKGIANLLKYEGEIITNKKLCFMSELVTYPVDIDLITFLNHLNNISDNKLNNEDLTELLKSFKLFEKQDELISNLSKGMKAKINIIQCLMEKAELYLLDEPLSGLDKDGIYQLMNYLEKSSNYFLISTHLPSAFEKIVDETYYL